jgi:RNA polymerase sigma factor (sigma-70 family)
MRFQIYRASELDMIEGCKKGDRHAQKLLYDRFSGKMYALCCRYVKDKMEAEDVLLTAFTKILDRINQYKNEGSFEGWIRRVMVNESLSYLRKNKSMYVETDIDAVDKEPNYEKLENHLEAQDLLKLISELPSGYRIVFNMFAIDGYSHKEIGEQLGINENTSKSQLSRARTVLQKKLLELDNVGMKESKEKDI